MRKEYNRKISDLSDDRIYNSSEDRNSNYSSLNLTEVVLKFINRMIDEEVKHTESLTRLKEYVDRLGEKIENIDSKDDEVLDIFNKFRRDFEDNLKQNRKDVIEEFQIHLVAILEKIIASNKIIQEGNESILSTLENNDNTIKKTNQELIKIARFTDKLSDKKFYIKLIISFITTIAVIGSAVVAVSETIKYFAKQSINNQEHTTGK